MDSYLPFKAGTPEVVACLLSEYRWLKLLRTPRAPYLPLIDYLTELGEGEGVGAEDDGRPSAPCQVNTISAQTGCTPSRVRGWIFRLYDDLIRLNAASPLLFREQEGTILHKLSFSTVYGFWGGINVWLPIRLQLNDSFRFPFIRAKVDYSHFYVSSYVIGHQCGAMTLDVHLKGGWGENSYRKLLLEKLKFTRELSLGELCRQDDVDIDKLLLEHLQRLNPLF